MTTGDFYYPSDHPLHGIPQPILDAARAVMEHAAEWKDVDPEHADPLADAVVQALLPFLVWRPAQPTTEGSYLAGEYIVHLEPGRPAAPLLDGVLAALAGPAHSECCAKERFCENTPLRHWATCGHRDYAAVERFMFRGDPL